jgi:hypothetical protein
MLRNQRKPPAAGKRDLLSRPDGVGALSLADNKRPPGAARGTVGFALIRRQLEACCLAVVFCGQRRWRCNGYLLWSVELERWRFMLL